MCNNFFLFASLLVLIGAGYLILRYLDGPKHVHDFGLWELRSVKSSQYGDFVFVQERQCKTCGYREFNKKNL